MALRVVIRADGDSRIGIGHVMRMVAVSETVAERGGETTVVSSRLDDNVRDRIRASGAAVVQTGLSPGSDDDAVRLVGEAQAAAANWVVLDGDAFDAGFVDRVRAAGLRTLSVDDHGTNEHYGADIVLNQNVFASPEMYARRRPDTRLLLGPAFALIRREFMRVASEDPAPLADRARRILVTLGGADPENATLRVLESLSRNEDPALSIRVVLGPSNPHRDRVIAETVDRRVAVAPATDDMSTLMSWADVAISGAGGTIYELCCLGVPSMVVAITEQQIETMRAVERHGVAVAVGWHREIDSMTASQTIAALCEDRRRRTALRRRARELVDGRGASRVVDVLSAT